MATSNMHNLTTLIKRLEAATLRLEDMAIASVDQSAPATGHPSISSASGVGAVGATSNGSQPPPPPVKTPEPLPRGIEEFDGLINGEVTKFVNLSEEIGGLVAEQASGVLRAFAAERKILLVATKAKKPDVQSASYMEILTELQHEMGAVSDIREANRASPLFNHLTTVTEGIQALAWITIDPKPATYISDTIPSAQFYGDRILVSYKDKDRKHTDWVRSFYQIFRSLTTLVKDYYGGGLTWNNKDGIDAKDAMKQVQGGKTSIGGPAPISPPTAGGAPPPPPPPLPNFDNPPPGPGTPAAGKGGDMGAVFNQLNQGSSVTSGLRKVDPSQMTHKNPSLRAGATVPQRSDSGSSSTRGKSPAPPGKKPKPESMRQKKPPRKELDGNKWLIENYDSPSAPLEINAEINHSILISRCVKTVVVVKGKANAISVDNSTRLSLVIDSLVSSVDVIKAPNFALQVMGKLPTILLDQVDGAQIYLSHTSLGTELFTSKCSSINVNLPGGTEEDDFLEEPLPEQIRSFISGGKMKSEIVEHAG